MVGWQVEHLLQVDGLVYLLYCHLVEFLVLPFLQLTKPVFLDSDVDGIILR